jgi:uncharacterized protein YutE (UPF0331/DUF86 family)
MEPHKHADYEATFQRIATVLDVIVESQSKHAEQMAEIREAHVHLEQTVDRLSQTVDKLSQTVGRNSDKVDAILEKHAVRSAENEDKLNALIDLMDRHVREHHDNK